MWRQLELCGWESKMIDVITDHMFYEHLKTERHMYTHKQTYMIYYTSVQFSSVTQSCSTLCDPMDCSMSGLPVHHPTPRVYSNSCPLSQWYHPIISSSITPFSSNTYMIGNIYTHTHTHTHTHTCMCIYTLFKVCAHTKLHTQHHKYMGSEMGFVFINCIFKVK